MTDAKEFGTDSIERIRELLTKATSNDPEIVFTPKQINPMLELLEILPNLLEV